MNVKKTKLTLSLLIDYPDLKEMAWSAGYMNADVADRWGKTDDGMGREAAVEVLLGLFFF